MSPGAAFDSQKYDFFGSINKEPPQLTMARSVLADAYERVGNYKKARSLWKEVKKIAPTCYEAQQKFRRLSSSKERVAQIAKKVKGFLGSGK